MEISPITASSTRTQSRSKIHPTAIIEAGAEIHETVEVGPWCIVGAKVKIGAKTKLLSHVVVSGSTFIGEENTIHPFSVIGGPPQDLKYNGEETFLFIGNRNEIREAVTINTGTVQGGGKTVIGDDNLLMATVHLGHDVLVGNHTVIANGCAIAGHVVIEDFVILGGQTGVSQFIRLGAHSYLGGQSGIERDVPPYVYAVGRKPTVLKGANIVGLKRRGFKTEVISQINEAIKLWLRPDVEKERCLFDIESEFGEAAEVRQFVQFIRESKSGALR